MLENPPASLDVVKLAGEFFGYTLIAILGWGLVRLKKLAKAKFPTKAIENSHRIREIMTEIRACLEADRVKIFQFKNGDYYVTGASEQKIIITHIVSRVGVGFTDGVLSFQSVPVSLAGNFLRRASEKKMSTQSVEDIDDDSVLKGFFLMNGTSSVLTYRLMKNRQIIGLVVVTWMEPQVFDDNHLNSREIDTFIAYLEKLLA